MTDVFVYTIRTENVRQADFSLLKDRMPMRTERAMQYRFERDRLLCIGAGLLMMKALGIRDEGEICYGTNGKPYVPGKQAFNISHSGDTCILACGEVRDLGADIEEIREKHLSLAPTIYTGAELEWMKEDPVTRFFRLRTWKESIAKAAGTGLNLQLKSFEVLPFAEGKPVRALDRDWYAREDKTDRSLISVCADEPIRSLSRFDYE